MQKVLFVDWEKCTGCRLCEMACSIRHEGECNPQLSRIRIVTFPGWGASFPSTCAACTVALCKEVCPVGAICIDDEIGMPVVKEELCIGCKECVVHCPLGAAAIHPRIRKAMMCDLCGGDPECIKFCSHGAITYKTIEESNMAKRRSLVCDQLTKAGVFSQPK